ncbi:APC family permease [Bifidobacterium aesculapii]|uniref:APC family permease n=1 Tax=Bifidobacterium aesculapii TaxID=1329411 RepID=UPI003520293C
MAATGGLEARQGRAGLGTASLTALAVGGVVGLGVMSMAGIGIGITGTGLWTAALTAGILAAVALAPQLAVSAGGAYPGGQYEQVGALLGARAGGVVAYLMCFLVFDVTAYAWSAAKLLHLPSLAERTLAAIIVVVFVAIHALGARVAAVAQLVMAVLLAVAFGVYAAYLAPHVRAEYLTRNVFLGSPAVFLFAVLYMTFMVNGVASVANYAAVTREPRVAIPRAMRLSLVIVVVLYTVLCVLDAGVLPIDRVANRDLSVSAGAFMPSGIAAAFVASGSAFALLTTLNAVIGWIVHPLRAAARDGWLPKELAAVSERTGTPVRLLAVLAAAGVVPLIAGVSTMTVSSSVTILTIVVQLAIAAGATRRQERPVVRGVCAAACVVDVLLIIWLLYTMNTLLIAGNAVLLLIAVLAAYLRGASLPQSDETRPKGNVGTADARIR